MIANENDLILLNAYLDGELAVEEQAAFEQRLQQEPALQAELESLRVTVALLQMAERVPLPRNFTLDPAVYGKARRSPWWQRLGLGGLPRWAAVGVMTLAVMILVGALITQGLGGFGGAASAPQVAMEAAPVEELAAEAAEIEAPAAEEPMAEESAAEEAPNTFAAEAVEEAAAEEEMAEVPPAAEEPAGEAADQDLPQPTSMPQAQPEPTHLPTSPVLMPTPTASASRVGEAGEGVAEAEESSAPGEAEDAAVEPAGEGEPRGGFALPALLTGGAVLLLVLLAVGFLFARRRSSS